jgi:hypothetical protein
MSRLSTRSNPTGLLEIDKKRINISVDEVEGRRHFILRKLDLTELKLAEDLVLVCMARCGKTSQRVDMGTVGSWRRESIPLEGLDKSGRLEFRILVHAADSPKLIASAESLRLLEEGQSESLIPMEPAALGELLWRLDINEGGPVLKYNSDVFQSAAVAENYLPFVALVLPEVFRQILRKIAEDYGKCLDDEGDPLSGWSGWLEANSAGRPSGNEDEEVDYEWCDNVVRIFCERFRFAGQMKEMLKGGTGSD